MNDDETDVRIAILIRPQTLSRAMIRLPKRFHSVFDCDADVDEIFEDLIDWIPVTEDWILYEIQRVSKNHFIKNYVQ